MKRLRILSIDECVKKKLITRHGSTYRFINCKDDPGYGYGMGKYFGKVHTNYQKYISKGWCIVDKWFFPIEVCQDVTDPLKMKIL